MARRDGAAGGVRVQGLREALAAYWARLDQRWAGQRFGSWAEAVERGDEMQVSGETIWLALFRAGSRLQDVFFHNRDSYVLPAGADVALKVMP